MEGGQLRDVSLSPPDFARRLEVEPLGLAVGLKHSERPGLHCEVGWWGKRVVLRRLPPGRYTLNWLGEGVSQSGILDVSTNVVTRGLVDSDQLCSAVNCGACARLNRACLSPGSFIAEPRSWGSQPRTSRRCSAKIRFLVRSPWMAELGDAREQFLKRYRVIRKALKHHRQQGVLILAFDEQATAVGQAWLKASLDKTRAVVVGRHSMCGLAVSPGLR